MPLPPPSPLDTIASDRWPEGGGPGLSPPNELQHQVACAWCKTESFDDGTVALPEQALPDLLGARQWLEERLLTDPAGRCSRCDGARTIAGVRLFVRSETLEKDVVVDLSGGDMVVRFMDARRVGRPVAASDPRLRAAFQDGVCRAALQMLTMSEDRARRARGHLEKLLEDNGRSPEPWIALAHVALALDEDVETIEHALGKAERRAEGLGFDGALRLAAAWSTLAERVEGHEHAESRMLRWLEEAHRQRSDDPAVALELGRAYLECDRIPDAERLFGSALEDPELGITAAYLLGRAALRRGAGSRARDIFRKLLDAMGRDPHLLRLLALAEADLGEVDLARRLLEEARVVDEEDPENEEVAEAIAAYEAEGRARGDETDEALSDA